MALEIERRFLVAGQDWRPHCLWQRRLQQGYLLAAADGLTLRVRTALPLGAAANDPARTSDPAREAEAHLTLKAVPPSAPAAGAEPGRAALAEPGLAAGGTLGRLEFEYPIPFADAEELLALCPSRLSKCRYGLDLPGGDWVLDVFEADNAPLVVAEVELERADQPVPVPPWCVQEITGEHALSNAALARQPMSCWSATQRRQRLGAFADQLGPGSLDSLGGSTQQLKPSRQILP